MHLDVEMGMFRSNQRRITEWNAWLIVIISIGGPSLRDTKVGRDQAPQPAEDVGGRLPEAVRSKPASTTNDTNEC